MTFWQPSDPDSGSSFSESEGEIDDVPYCDSLPTPPRPRPRDEDGKPEPPPPPLEPVHHNPELMRPCAWSQSGHSHARNHDCKAAHPRLSRVLVPSAVDDLCQALQDIKIAADAAEERRRRLQGCRSVSKAQKEEMERLEKDHRWRTLLEGDIKRRLGLNGWVSEYHADGEETVVAEYEDLFKQFGYDGMKREIKRLEAEVERRRKEEWLDLLREEFELVSGHPAQGSDAASVESPACYCNETRAPVIDWIGCDNDRCGKQWFHYECLSAQDRARAVPEDSTTRVKKVAELMGTCCIVVA